MKKIYSFMVAAVAMFAAASCAQELENNTPEAVGETVVFTASVDGAETKAVLNETTKRSEWVAGDKITLHNGTKSYDFTAAAAGPSADFSYTGNDFFGSKFMAVYPAGTYTADPAAKTVKAYIPTWQQAQTGTYHSPAALAVAYTENTNTTLQFKNAHALLKFTVNTDNVTHVVFHGNNSEAITGDVNVTLGAEGVQVQCLETEFITGEGEGKVTETKYGTWVECYAYHDDANKHFIKGQTYYIAVAPQVFNGGVTVKVRINDGEEKVARTTTKKVEAKAGVILDLGAIEYEDPSAGTSGWSLPGNYNDWNTTDTYLYEVGDYYVAKNVSGLNTGFKFNHAEYGWKCVGSDTPVAVGQWHKLVEADPNIFLPSAVAYDIYMTKDGKYFQAVTAGSAVPSAPPVVADYWALIGSMTSWSDEYKLVAEGDYLVYKELSLTAGDTFKFRKNGDYAEGELIVNGGVAEADTEYNLVSSSSNMKVSAAGQYNVYVKSDLSKAYFMTNGKTPAQAGKQETYRFYVQNKKEWSDLYFYAWGTYASSGWPGDKMTAEANAGGSYGVCKYVEIPKGSVVQNFIINGGGDSQKTGDLTLSDAKSLGNGDYIYVLE